MRLLLSVVRKPSPTRRGSSYPFPVRNSGTTIAVVELPTPSSQVTRSSKARSQILSLPVFFPRRHRRPSSSSGSIVTRWTTSPSSR